MGQPALKHEADIDKLAIKAPWDEATGAYKNWQKVEEKSRKDREKAARSALASCYRFALQAFANEAEFTVLKKACQIKSRENTSQFLDAVKVCFGFTVVENDTQEAVWEPIKDQLAHKYVKVMDYAAFRSVAAGEMEAWLNKDAEDAPKSISKRYAEAVGSTEYKEYCRQQGYYVKDDDVATHVEITKEQQENLNQFIFSETDLEPGNFTPGITVQIKQVDESGHTRILELPGDIKGITDTKAIQDLINKVTEVEPSAKGFKRLMSILRLASVIKLRKNDMKGRIIELSNSTQGMSVKIAHNDAKGSIQLELTYDTPDFDLPTLNTTLTEDFIKWVPVLYSTFGGDWEAIEHQVEPGKKEPFIQITPPAGMTVSARIAAINAKKTDTAEKIAEKRAKAKTIAYTAGKVEIKKFHRPPFATLTKGEKTLLVPLTNLVKADKKVRFAILRDDVGFESVTATFSPETVKAIIKKEEQVIKARVDNPSDPSKKIPRVQGDLFSLRMTHARLGFCDMDGMIVGHVDMPNKIGPSDFRRDYMLAKGSLLTVLNAIQAMMPRAPVKFEFSETLMRLSAKSGKKKAEVLLPAATSAYSGNTTAFTFYSSKDAEKTQEKAA